MWKPRLVALDLDGTLVAPDGSVPVDVAEAVQAASAAGAHVVLATGRGWHATRWLHDLLDLPPALGAGRCVLRSESQGDSEPYQH